MTSETRDGAGMHPGWWAVAVLFVCGLSAYGAGIYSFVLFVEPLSAEFGWSRASVAGLVSVFWLAAPLSLFTGLLTKRFNIWYLVAAGLAIEALCLAALVLVTELWQMYALRILMGFGKILVYIVIPVAVSRWFSARFGTALAIAFAGWHIGGVVLSPLVGLLIATGGWRLASVTLACVLILTATLPLLLARHTRSPAKPAGSGASELQAAPSLATYEARAASAFPWAIFRMPALWLLGLATVGSVTGLISTLTHQAAIIESAGTSTATASIMLAYTAGFAACGALCIGWVIDRLGLVWAAVLQQSLCFAGVTLLLAWLEQTQRGWLLVAHVIGFGLAFGSWDIFWATLIRRRFGEQVFPFVFGPWYFTGLATSVVGPIVAGRLFDLWGGYSPVIVVLLVSFVPAAVVAMALVLALSRRAPGRVVGRACEIAD